MLWNRCLGNRQRNSTRCHLLAAVTLSTPSVEMFGSSLSFSLSPATAEDVHAGPASATAETRGGSWEDGYVHELR